MARKNDEHPCVTFLKSLYQNCEDGFINLRFLPSGENQFIPLNQIETIPAILKNHGGQNCHFGVATRVDGDGSKVGIVQIPAVWVEIDSGKMAEDEKGEVHRRIREFPLKWSIGNNSGGGSHVYWMLKEPVGKNDIPRVEGILKRLSAYFHGDRNSTDGSRILRIPGTSNHKYTPPRMVSIKSCHPERAYSLDDFEGILPPLVEETREEPPKHNDRLNQVMECAFLQHCDRARATLLEPEWYAAISILARESGGPALIHQLSKGYPKYSPAETDKKILHAINGSGPATCARIKELYDCGKECGLKSPVSLAYQKPDERNHPDNKAPANCQDKSKHHFNLIWARDIVDTQEPEREWIWEGILPAGGLSLVVAKPKVGKTTLALQLAVAVSRGDIFLGRKTRQATVVYLALEEHRGEVQKNLSKLGVTNEPLYIHFGPAPVEAMREVEPLIKETGAKFLVIDILQKFCRVKDLNDYAQVTRTLEPLMASGRKLDCQISLTHHAGKADREDGDDILGSTGLLGGVDTSIHIKKRTKESRIFSTIQRYGADVLQTVIALKDGCLVMEGSREEVEIGETAPLILVALEEGPLAEKDVWGKVGKDHSRVSSALRKLVEQKAVIRTGTGKRGDPFIYEKDSLLLSAHIYEEGKRETKVEPNLLESENNISLDDFHKNQPDQERIKRDISIEKQAEEDPSKGGLYEVMADGQFTY